MQGKVNDAVIALKMPFVHPIFQAIADKQLCIILAHDQIRTSLSPQAQSEALWFRLYQANKLYDEVDFEVARDALQELQAIPADADDATIAEKLSTLEAKMGDFRSRILTEIRKSNLPQGNWLNPTSYIRNLFWAASPSHSNNQNAEKEPNKSPNKK